jgi:hypothetical protein
MKLRVAIAAAVTMAMAQGVTMAQEEHRLPPAFDCTEVARAEANDENTGYEPKRPLERVLEFTFAERDPGQYALIGALGMSDMPVRIDGQEVVHLIEISDIGNVNVTTIAIVPLGRRYSAVHSRHPAIGGLLAPSQFLLSCAAR